MKPLDQTATQSTAVSVLMMGQVLFLLTLVPSLTLATPEGIVRASLWGFQVLMAIHWWYGAQFFLTHLGPARTLPAVYLFFAMLGLAWLPALYLHDLAAFMFVFSGAFVLAYVRYATLLPSLPEGGVREYVRKKARVELAGAAMLVGGGLTGLLVTDPLLQAWMAPGGIVIQAVMIGYCVRELYPLVETAKPAPAPVPAEVVPLIRAS